MKITSEQVRKWNAKLMNGFKLDVEHCVVWNEKEAAKLIPLPDGRRLRAEIGWYEVYSKREDAPWRRDLLGVRPALTLSLWESTGTPGVWGSHGLGARVDLTEQVYTKRVWNELAKYTAAWTDEKLLAEAKKHMAELQDPYVA